MDFPVPLVPHRRTTTDERRSRTLRDREMASLQVGEETRQFFRERLATPFYGARLQAIARSSS